MLLHLVALKTTKYNDTRTILTAYSREYGRVSLSLPAGTGKIAARLRALTMPLGLVECMSDRCPGREIMPLRQASQSVALSSVHSDPLKQMVAMFIAEILSVILQGGEPDTALYDFIEGSVRLLDVSDSAGTANFHICFLYNLGRHLGIEPDTSTYTPGAIFDVVDGLWRTTAPLHRRYLRPDEAEVAFRLSRMTFANMHRFRFNRSERNRIVDGMIEYYSVHYVSLRNLRSLDVLRTLL